MKLFPPGGVSSAGRSLAGRPMLLEDVYPGAYDPHARLKDMAVDGVEAEVLYPSIAMRLYAQPDVELKQACFEAYNTWIAEFCSAYPDRFKGIGMIALDDIEGAVAELHRVRKLGLAGAMVAIASEDPTLYGTESQDRFWATAEGLELPVSLHVDTDQKALPKFTPITESLRALEIQRTLANMVFGGLFYRFPKLTVVSAENDAGWAAYLLGRMDRVFNVESRRREYNYFIKDKSTLPSEYFRRNVAMTFIWDSSGVDVRHWVGVENLMWGSDYPHDASTWPNSRQVLEDFFQGVPDSEREKIVAGNAERLYGFN